MAKNIAAWSKRMKELRVENNLSQTDVAKVLHCSQVAYGMYELGKRRISVENLVKLAPSTITSQWITWRGSVIKHSKIMHRK